MLSKVHLLCICSEDATYKLKLGSINALAKPVHNQPKTPLTDGVSSAHAVSDIPDLFFCTKTRLLPVQISPKLSYIRIKLRLSSQ